MRLEIETGRFYLGRDYSEAIEAAGGVPVHISLIPKPDYIADILADLDGILLPGSNTDVDPHYYGEEPHHKLGTVIPEKDETERLVIEEAERRNLPMLAICYGMQALNVVRGGTLIQDIESQLPGSIKHQQGMPATRDSHGLKIAAGSFFSELPAIRDAERPIRVNSSHHQAIGKVGKDLNAVAWSPDGVIEGLQDTRTGRFVVGVQWHPELSWANDRFSRGIFDMFISHCQKETSAGISP